MGKKSNFMQTLWRQVRRLTDLSDYIDVEASSVNIRGNIAFRGPNILILFCAIIIASIGLNVNSIPVIIGAMLISPLMSPIVGMGLALGTNDTDLLRHALKNLGVMVGISILASTLFFLVSPLDMEHPTELLARTNPTIYDVLIALFGGFAGIVEASRKEKGTVISGVAIATALMPPLCTVGYGLSSWQPQFFLGALYLFFINSVFIALAAFIGTKYLGYPKMMDADPEKQRKRMLVVAVFLVIMIIPSIFSGISVIRDNNLMRSVNQFVQENKSIGKSYIYDYKIVTDSKPATVELFVAGEALSTEDYSVLYARAESYGLMHSQIAIHQDAAYSGLSELDVLREVLRTHEERENALLARGGELQAEVDSLRSVIEASVLPTKQLENEIRTQYPHVVRVMLASTTDVNRTIVVLVYNEDGKRLSESNVATLTAWLQVRLGTEHVCVVQQ